jgi:type IV secretory pathway protease TraF
MTNVRHPISHYIVHGNSMLPTLKPGQHVFTINWFLKVKVGDLVVAKVDGRDLVKKVSKVSKVPKVSKGKKVTVTKLSLVGDNEKESTDSRKFGLVNRRQIIGKVFLII